MTLFFRISATASVFCTAIALFGMTSEGAQAASKWSARPAWADGAQRAPANREATRYSTAEGSSVIAPFSPGSSNLSLDVGQVFLMGDLGSDYADNLGSQLHYTYGVSDLFAFNSSLGYSQHSDGEYSMTNLLTGVRMNLAWYDKVVPYADFGLGFYRPSYRLDENNSISSVLFGLHLGPGVDLELTRQLFFGASLTFHDMFGQQKKIPAGTKNIGGTYTSFFLRAGVTF